MRSNVLSLIPPSYLSLNEETIILSEITIANYVFVDIETNLSGTFILMICVFDAHKNICKQFTAYDYSDMEEKKILGEFLSFASTYNSFYCYSGSNFDRRILIKRLVYHKIDEAKLPLIKDVCFEIRKTLFTYLNTYELKSLGYLFGFKWRHPNIDGIQVPQLYQQFLLTRNEKIIKNIQEKNQDDVLVLKQILSQIKKMQIGKPYSFPIAGVVLQ